MKKALLTKLFYFSASFSSQNEIHGHNYTLGVTVDYSEDLNEALLEEKIQTKLIHKIHSRDLGLDVDFLKNIVITDHALLTVFSEIIHQEIKPIKLHELFLERDRRTRLLISVGE